MSLKQYAIAAGIGLALTTGGYIAGHHMAPTKTVTVSHTEYQDRIVEKQVIQFKDRIVTQIQHDQVTHTEWVKQPDGTTKVETTVTDKSHDQSTTDTKMQDSKQTDSQVTNKSDTKVTATYSKSNYGLQLNTTFNAINIHPNSYSLELSRRLAGPLFVSVGTSTHRELSLGLRLEW
jgi:hypothetical protein